MKDRRQYFIDVALTCFRDNADRDYAHARLAYRSLLGNQFLWSAIHCIEKYAKCICLLNGVSSKGVGHKALRAIQKVQSERPHLAISIQDEVLEFIRGLEQNGAEERYMGLSYIAIPGDLVSLDMAVFSIRKHCFPHMTAEEIAIWKELCEGDRVPQYYTRPYSGWLEEVAHTPNHNAHEAIAWNNAQLGKSIPGPPGGSFGNWMFARSPLSQGTPELLEELDALITIPRYVKEACLREIAGGSKP